MNPETHLFLEGGLALIGGLSSLWMKGVLSEIRQLHAEMKELVKTVTDHGERIAVLESRMERLDK